MFLINIRYGKKCCIFILLPCLAGHVHCFVYPLLCKLDSCAITGVNNIVYPYLTVAQYWNVLLTTNVKSQHLKTKKRP